MNFAHKKIFMGIILIFSLCSTAYAAAIGGAPAAPSASAAGPASVPSGMAPDAPAAIGEISIGDVPAIDTNTNTNTNTNTELFGTSENLTTETEASTNSQTGREANSELNYAAEATIDAQEINGYFEEILTSGQTGNAMGNLMRRLPRYGMSFFRNAPSTFAPRESVPVTLDYRINVGDSMTLSIWGIPEEGNFNFTVNRDGMASIPRIGIIRLAGMTVAQAESAIRSRLNQYYTGFQMNLSMGHLSSILVYVTGNAARPGAYTISSFSTLVNALLASGGPSRNGTLRKIELKRGGRTIAVFDMYAMLLKGDKTQDVRLEAGDVIYIPPVGPLVGVAGEIRMPGVYELNGTTRVQDILFTAGGLNAMTFQGRVQYYRIFGNAYASAFEGTLKEFENFKLNDGDIIRLYPIFNLSTTVSITGPIIREGTYAIVPGETKISDIINRAGGLTNTASDTAEISRVTPTLEGPMNERFKVNIFQALKGDPQNNIKLEANDLITVLPIPEWKTQLRVVIGGEVKRPGTYAMFEGERLSDLIERAGGFTERAFLRGAIFTRESVARDQRRALNQMADQLERDLYQNMPANTENAAAYQTEINQRRQLVSNLRNIDIIGRVLTKIDSPKALIGTEWDHELRNGDALNIPRTPLTVNIIGAVYSNSSHVYNSKMSIGAYINAAGGALRNAHKRMVYLLKADGSVIRLTRRTGMLATAWKAPKGYSATIEPGDTIVVPVKYYDATGKENFRDTVDIIYKVAVAAGVIINAMD